MTDKSVVPEGRRLSDLNPEFYRSEGDARRGYLRFDCPICPAVANHRLQMPTHDFAPQHGVGGAKRWHIAGRPGEWDTISLSPSIDLQDRCRWHGFIISGEAQ